MMIRVQVALSLLIAATGLLQSPLCFAQDGSNIALDLRPRVCTMTSADEVCETTVRAQWRSVRDESLCLVIVGRPEVKRCWDNFTEGHYSIELAFAEDLVVQLRDPALENVLASAAIRVIREAIQLRRKRKQPWNILY
jgi:Protein of unknown function (DUF3019)